MTARSPAIAIAPEDVRCEYVHSSGPGGQNVNKVATAVQLRFDARNCRGLEPAVRERLYRLAGRRVNAAGEVVIVARRVRTQQRNREDAYERLALLLEKAAAVPKIRRRSRPTAASRDRRLGAKKRRSEIKRLRSRSSAED